ncbi:MAG: hypothetical protein Q7R51_01780 [bacterium]|nr:hypothetical protein [bacterium]
MNEEDKKYLKAAKKMRSSLEVFERLVQILSNIQDKTDQLLKTSLSKTA